MSLTLGAWLTAATARLTAAGVEAPRRDARLLAAHGLSVSAGALLTMPERMLTPDEGRILEELVARRERREPVSRIVGRRGFWTFDLSLSPDTLDPRPDTETLVEAVLKRLPPPCDRPLRLLDLGTGSGCLLLALLLERPDGQGVGVDLAPGAAQTARHNAASLGLSDRSLFVVSDWTAGLRGPFDGIVSNPPYIPTAEIGTLAPEVRTYDPWRALDGGLDGLAPYPLLVKAAADLLVPGGLLGFEVGIGQADRVEALMAAEGFEGIESVADLANIPRCIIGTLKRSVNED